MTRLERYVLAELWLTFGLALAALTFLMVLRAFVEPVREGIPVGLLVRCLPLMIPYAMSWTIPTAFVVACVMTYSRMAEANELTAVRASGGHLWMVLGPAAATALLLSAFCGLLNHYVVPKTRFDQYARLKAASQWEQLTAVRLGEPVVDIGRCKVYMRRMNPDDSFEEAVVVFEEKMLADSEATGGRRQVTYLKAPRGHFEYSDADGCLVFYLAGEPAGADPGREHRDRFAGKGEMCKVPQGAGPLDFQRAYYGLGIIPVPLRELDELVFVPEKGKHMTTGTLIQRVLRRRAAIRAGVRPRPDLTGMTPEGQGYALKRWRRWAEQPRYWSTEGHERSALAIAPLLLAAIAVPLGVITRRGRKLVAFGLGIFVVLGGYYPLLAAGTKMGRSGMLPPAVAVWGMMAVIGAVGLVLTSHVLRR